MVVLGTAFYRHEHVYFVISDPGANAGQVLCVNLTTMDTECVDDECQLDENDYAWIHAGHPTVVAFSRAAVWPSATIDQCLQNGQLHAPNPPIVPAAAVAKVVAAAQNSVQLSAAAKAML